MGFDCKEELTIPRFGLLLAGCYVTLKGSVNQTKGQNRPFAMPGVPMANSTLSAYTLSGQYSIYANKDAPEPLFQEYIQMGLDEAPTDPLNQLYQYLKSQKFSGKTLTDN
jgi:hypothetical protein